MTVSRYLFDKHPNLPEGNLTKMRATIVCEPSLVIFANKIQLNQLILLGKGEEKRVVAHALHLFLMPLKHLSVHFIWIKD